MLTVVNNGFIPEIPEEPIHVPMLALEAFQRWIDSVKLLSSFLEERASQNPKESFSLKVTDVLREDLDALLQEHGWKATNMKKPGHKKAQRCANVSEDATIYYNSRLNRPLAIVVAAEEPQLSFTISFE